MTRSLIRCTPLVWLLCFAMACGPDGEGPDTTLEPVDELDQGKMSQKDMGEQQKPDLEDATMSEDLGTTPPVMMCASPELSACGKLCTNLQEDVKHCGACGHRCGTGSSCLDGECICFSTGKSWCGVGACIDMQTDRRHCGQCGNSCASASYCDQGVCTGDGVLGEVIALTNEARMTARDCGGTWMQATGSLAKNDQLTEAAQKHAEDMAARNYFEHNTPDGVTPTERMRAAGYQGGATGENIAAGQRSPAEVVQDWIDSPGHCRNMMSPSYNEIGIGFHPEGPQRPYWVQNFGHN